MKILKDKTITDVPYIKASGISCGLKRSGKNDLCVIYSEKKAVAAATFTTNKVKAAPIQLNMESIKSQNTQAIVVNSANANSCTGEEGFKNAKLMAETAANELNLSPSEILVQSTGVIGPQLPMEKLIPGIKKGCSLLSKDGGFEAAKAIMTTDTFSKTLTIEFELDGKNILMSGIAKGSGMIHPNMATMLSFILTDASISKEMLDLALKDSVNKSYNMISVDGDTSTNDMCAILANGAAENKTIKEKDENYIIFKEALDFLNTELSKLIAKDGEGATKLLETIVLNAKSLQDARLCAKSVISSNLTKCAFFGSDANWGRIICALGYSGADFDPLKVDLYFQSENGKIQLMNQGFGLNFDEGLAKKILEPEKVNIIVNLNNGDHSATAWGCDLTYDYVKINGSYRT